ncbi:hypothetical protein Salat_1520000 [Sesamum alatum]|uniref:Thionin-like protein 2 n=1 Tax=Sesamum alatum TaxID=300844 RepID=A0AAE1YC27_9LAMI|nr:hypothetical protein Salat_1520000 [Sesamum alatum]
MEMRKVSIMRAVVLVVLGVGMLTERCSASFKDCYTKCFIFCMIEPSQTLCSCTTHCLKDCIFQEIQNDLHEQDSDNLAFCKLGCAFSMCSTFSTKRTPNGDKVDGCVGSCSNKCIKSYASLSPP